MWQTSSHLRNCWQDIFFPFLPFFPPFLFWKRPSSCFKPAKSAVKLNCGTLSLQILSECSRAEIASQKGEGEREIPHFLPSVAPRPYSCFLRFARDRLPKSPSRRSLPFPKEPPATHSRAFHFPPARPLHRLVHYRRNQTQKRIFPLSSPPPRSGGNFFLKKPILASCPRCRARRKLNKELFLSPRACLQNSRLNLPAAAAASAGVRRTPKLPIGGEGAGGGEIGAPARCCGAHNARSQWPLGGQHFTSTNPRG